MSELKTEFIVSVQEMENYGAHTAEGEKVSNHWKFKGSTQYIVTGANGRSANAVALVARKFCSTSCSYISYVAGVDSVAMPTAEEMAQGYIAEVDTWESGDWEYRPRIEIIAFDPFDIPQPADVVA